MPPSGAPAARRRRRRRSARDPDGGGSPRGFAGGWGPQRHAARPYQQLNIGYQPKICMLKSGRADFACPRTNLDQVARQRPASHAPAGLVGDGTLLASAAGSHEGDLTTPEGGCSTVVVRQPSKLFTRVRFPSPAPTSFATIGDANGRE